ncbi:hypothetical protein ACFQ4L_10535 [Lapidilactobacillus mulanensis]|uniref:DNA-binding protein n=1 Tax=Lapidilactobacillus mulanensis TaxID=2485999 RepID=A0ABW4DRQ2_9LACO|nr:hypothetical protein [Lapidilactobacillus mulanensis]
MQASVELSNDDVKKIAAAVITLLPSALDTIPKKIEPEMNKKQIAKMVLGCDVSQIEKLEDLGMPFVLTGNHHRYIPEDVRKWRRKHQEGDWE